MDFFSLDAWQDDTILPFSHEPLNHGRPSIRLLRVLPTLFRGLIQCEISNESTQTDFSCLSYTWGESMVEYQILINGRLFSVRKNLLEFLDVARTTYPLRAFWIDAICIDQTKVEERNHQVAQMGQIYSKAHEVIIWLGANKALANFLSTWPHYVAAAKVKAETSGQSLASVKAGYLALVDHPYWRRAWVTQEIVLARTSKLLAGDVELETTSLAGIAQAPYDSKPVLDSRFLSHVDIACGIRKLRGVPLIRLLYDLPNRQCSLPRDQIYSLLSLAAEGPDNTVDYDSKDTEFMFNMAKACERSLCLCSLGLLAETCREWSLIDMQVRSSRRRGDEATVLKNSHFHSFATGQYVRVDMNPSIISSASGAAERFRCGTCRFKLPWRSIEGPVICLIGICPLFHGHIYLKRSPHKGDIIRWKAGSFKRTFRISDDDTKLFGMSLQRSAKGKEPFTLRFSILFLLWREWRTNCPKVKRRSPTPADEALHEICEKAISCHGGFRVSRET